MSKGVNPSRFPVAVSSRVLGCRYVVSNFSCLEFFDESFPPFLLLCLSIYLCEFFNGSDVVRVKKVEVGS